MVGKTSHNKLRHAGKATLMTIALIAWAAFAFVAGQYIAVNLYQFCESFMEVLQALNQPVRMTIMTSLAWMMTLGIAVGIPYLLFKHRVTRQEIGLHRLPTWSEMGLAVVGYVASAILAGLVIYGVALVIPSFDAGQAQDVGFSNLAFRYEYLVAFITLVVIAPVVEEVFFRGYLYSRLKKYIPTWVAIIIVSALFGIAHGQANVAIMTFVMGVFLCLLRDLTGSLWPAIIMHMIRNGVAFFFLFVAPILFLN